MAASLIFLLLAFMLNELNFFVCKGLLFAPRTENIVARNLAVYALQG